MKANSWWRNQLKLIRHCFQCGGQLELRHVVEEGRRRHVCAGCEAITYTNPKIVAGCIPVMPDGRIVLLKRGIEPALGEWSVPAGFMELGETIQDAAARETLEEISVRVKIGAQIGLYSYAEAGVVTIIFEGRVLKGQTPKTTPESSEVAVLKPSQIPWKKLAFKSTRDALKDWVKQRD